MCLVEGTTGDGMGLAYLFFVVFGLGAIGDLMVPRVIYPIDAGSYYP